MIVSERKLKANRENAQKSTGPKTAEGKAASSDITKTGINPAKRPKMKWGPRKNDKTNPNRRAHRLLKHLQFQRHTRITTKPVERKVKYDGTNPFSL